MTYYFGQQTTTQKTDFVLSARDDQLVVKSTATGEENTFDSRMFAGIREFNKVDSILNACLLGKSPNTSVRITEEACTAMAKIVVPNRLRYPFVL